MDCGGEDAPRASSNTRPPPITKTCSTFRCANSSRAESRDGQTCEEAIHVLKRAAETSAVLRARHAQRIKIG